MTYSDKDIANAVVKLKALILSLPQSAAMIIPAQGEYHVDHRTVRKAALCAITESERVDILAYEVRNTTHSYLFYIPPTELFVQY